MRLRRWQNALVAAAVASTIALSAVAHHGWSDYKKQALTITGVIRASGYENPHGFVRLQVQSSGKKTWYIVLAPPSRMARRGLTRQALEAGTSATVVGYQHRTKPEEMRAERITIAGKATELR